MTGLKDGNSARIFEPIHLAGSRLHVRLDNIHFLSDNVPSKLKILSDTELEHEDNHTNWGATTNQRNEHNQQQSSPQNPVDQTPDSSLESTIVDESIPSKMSMAYHDDSSPTRMFGDTIMYRQSKQFRRISGGSGAPKPGPPPTLPAPVPTPVVPVSYPKSQSSQSHGFSSAVATPNAENRKSNYTKQVRCCVAGCSSELKD